MATINMHDAKTQLSDLVARAEAGEEIVIARRNRPAVRLVRVDAEASVRDARKRVAGSLAHLRGSLSPHIFDAPLAGEELDVLQGGFGENDQARFDLAGLPAAVEAGREFTIMKDGKPVAKVIPVEPKSRGWGAWEGRYRLPDTFFDPLPDDELGAWDGSDEPAA